MVFGLFFGVRAGWPARTPKNDPNATGIPDTPNPHLRQPHASLLHAFEVVSQTATSYPMLRKSASGSEIKFPGRILIASRSAFRPAESWPKG